MFFFSPFLHFFFGGRWPYMEQKSSFQLLQAIHNEWINIFLYISHWYPGGFSSHGRWPERQVQVCCRLLVLWALSTGAGLVNTFGLFSDLITENTRWNDDRKENCDSEEKGVSTHVTPPSSHFQKIGGTDMPFPRMLFFTPLLRQGNDHDLPHVGSWIFKLWSSRIFGQEWLFNHWRCFFFGYW